jgi:hypothetical protein
MSGFALAHRTVFDHPLFSGDSARLGAWLWLVGKACWRPTPFDISGKIVTLHRGQICVSRSQLAKAWGMSPSAVERFLTRLETEQMIGRATGQGRSIVTICNYEKYQAAPDEAGQATGQATGQRSDSDRTAKEQGNKGTIVEEPDGSSYERADERQKVVDCWNAMAKAHDLSACRLTEKRSRALTARLKRDGLDAIRQAIERIPKSSFLLGTKPSSDWRADIEFLLRPDSVTKILEGKYDDRPTQPTGHSGDGLVVALRRRLNSHDAEEPPADPDGRSVRASEGHSQGALALPSSDRRQGI